MNGIHAFISEHLPMLSITYYLRIPILTVYKVARLHVPVDDFLLVYMVQSHKQIFHVFTNVILSHCTEEILLHISKSTKNTWVCHGHCLKDLNETKFLPTGSLVIFTQNCVLMCAYLKYLWIWKQLCLTTREKKFSFNLFQSSKPTAGSYTENTNLF